MSAPRDDEPSLHNITCAYCGVVFQAWIPHNWVLEEKGSAECRQCFNNYRPTFISAITTVQVPLSMTVQDPSNMLPSSEVRKPTREDYARFVWEETQRVRDANPTLNEEQVCVIAQRSVRAKTTASPFAFYQESSSESSRIGRLIKGKFREC